MKTNYEIAYGKIIPAFRRAVAREMHLHYHMKQTDIAKRLGITQAAVSKYLNSGTGAGGSHSKEVEEFIKASLKGNERAVRQSVCKACQTARKFDCAFILKQ